MEQPLTIPERNPSNPGLTSYVQVARTMAHLFLGLGVLGVFISAGIRSAVPLLICVGGFLLSYFAWVALVLFGCMNFALSTMLWFVLGLGGCLGLLMSGEEPLMLLGGLGLLIMAFVTVIPVSRHDPTTPLPRRTPPRKARQDTWYPSSYLLLILPVVCFILLTLGKLIIPTFILFAIFALMLQASTIRNDPEAQRNATTKDATLRDEKASMETGEGTHHKIV